MITLMKFVGGVAVGAMAALVALQVYFGRMRR